MTTTILLERLEYVRQTGAHQWRARCPAHREKSLTLSVREVDDGKTLVHCFAGCDVSEVLSAVGLTVSALFDKLTTYDVTAPSKSSFSARETLALIDHEVLVAALIVGDILKERNADAEQWQRLGLCAQRIGAARDGCCPTRPAKEVLHGA